MKLWEELEQEPEYGLLSPEDRSILHDEWRSSILGSLADEDPEAVDAAGVNRFVATERARSQALKTGKPFDPATAEKDYLREVTDRTAAQKQAMKGYDELERAKFVLKDASARRGVTSAGDRGMPLDPRVAEILDRDRQEAQKKLDEVGSRFTPEMLQQVKEVREAEKGERPTAMLGSDLYTDPSLLLDKDKYRAAVAESDASPEAKARAMADFAEKRKQFAENSLRTLRVAGESPLPGAQDFPTWEASQPEDVRKLTPEDKALQYMREMQKRGDIRKLTSAIGTGLMQGGTDIASQGIGVAAMVANSGELAEKAAEVAEGAQTLEEVSKLEGDKQAAGATTLGGAARLVPSAAATIAPAALTGGASLGVSAALAGAQTAGAQFPNTYTELRKQGMPEQDALNAARNSAIASGIVTAGLTAAFGKTGMEAALGAGAGGKELVKSRLVAAMKAVPKGAVAEIPEELLDEMASQVIEQRTIDPEKPVSQIIDEFAETAPDLAMQIALLGGAGGAVGGYRGSTTEAAQEQEFPAAGTPPDLSQQDRDNFAQGGVPIFDTEGNVTGYTAPRAAETTASNEDIRKAAEEAIKPGIPVEVNGVTIATINPESGWNVQDVLDFANSPEDMATLARNKIITLPEVVAPIEGVDPAITDEMNARFAEGKAAGDANQTLAELERQKAAQTVDTEADIPETQIAPTVGETAAPEVDISADTESLGVTPPPAPALEAPEGAARNAEMLRQAAARAAGTEQGPRIGFLQSPSPAVTEDTYYHGSNEDFETFGTVRHAQTAQGRKSSVTPITKESRGQIYLTQDQDYAGTYGDKVKSFKIGNARLASFEDLGHRDVSADQMNEVLAGMGVDHAVKGEPRPTFEWLKYGNLKKPLVEAGFDGFRLQESRSDNGRVVKTVALFDNAKVSPVTTETETPIDAANVDGGSLDGVQTESAEGSVPTVTEDTVSISDIPSTAEIQPEVRENPTTTLDSKPSERIENAGSGVGSAEGQREMDQPSGTRYLPAQLQSTAPEVAQPKPVTNEQVQSKVEELLRAPTPVTRKPAVAFKTQTEESAFRRGFEAATKKQGEMPPPERAGLSPKDRKWDDAWRKGWASGQTFVRALPTQALEPGEESSVRTTPGEESPVISDPQAEWTPTVGEPATANINGQKVVGTVGPSTGGGLVSFQYEWNGKPQKAVVRPERLARPVASLTEPPSYQYTQEQNSRKAGKHFPTAPGVHANHDFRKSFASMAEDTSLSRIYRQIAKIMSKMDAFANIDLHIVADGRRGYAGEYSHSNGKSAIAVNLRQVARGKVDALGTILHEALHHITLAKVRNPQGAFENDVVQTLDQIRQRVVEYAKQQSLDKKLDYEIGTNEEFISAIFTRPDFQNFLASIPDSFAPGVSVGRFRSVLSEIFRLLAELVTGEMVAKGSTMEQAMTTVLALFETPHRTLDIGKLEKLSAVQSKPGYRTPADMLAEAAQKAKGEAVGTKPQGLASMFKPQAKRPATGERKLLDMPVRNTLANAYREAVRGSSTQMAPLSSVYAQARLLQPGLTPEAFLAQVQEGYDNGTLLLEGAGSQQEAEQAGLALPGTPVGTAVRMMPAPETPKSLVDEETDAAYLAAVEAGDMGTAQQMVDEAAKSAGYEKRWNFSENIGIDPNRGAFYTTSNKSAADSWGEGREGKTRPVFISSKAPAIEGKNILSSSFMTPELAGKLKAAGFDSASGGRDWKRGDEIAVFSPNQIKSADPVTRDKAGNVIPLSQRFNSESPSILYAAPIDISTLPTREPASGENVPDREAGSSENAETVSQRLESRRKEAISAAVAENDWGNYTREQKVAAAESFLAKWVVSFSAMEFPADVRFSVEVGDGSGAHVSVHEVPSRPLGIRVSVGQNRGLDKYANLSPTEVFAHLYDTAQEESIHVAQYLGMHRDWLEAREQGFKGTFLSYIGQKLKDTFDQINKARIDLQQTDSAAAEKIKDAMLASWNIYHFNDRVEGIAGLWSRLEGDPSRQGDFIMEMVRQLTQLKRQDFTTETGWQKFQRVLKQWITDAINSLRGVQDVFRSGMAGDLIQRQLADLEAALDGKPLPPVSRGTPKSKADEGEPPTIDIGGEAEPADGKGQQLYQKNPTAIGDTYISPADNTLQEKKTQQETLDAARKIIGEEIAKTPGNTLAGRRAALDRFSLDTSIPPEVRAVGTGVIAQQADRMANLSEGTDQLLLDEMADEAAKLSGIMSSDLEAWRNLKADANLQIDKMAEEAGRTLNIFNVFRRLTPEGFLRRMTRKYNDAVREKMGQNFDVPAGEVEAEIKKAVAKKPADPDKAIKDLMKSLKPKPRAPREKIERALKTLFTADTVGALDDQAFFDAFGEAFGMPPLSDEQQTRIKKLIREVNALPKGPARLDKQQDLDEELALWKGIAARDVLLSAWYANILSGVSTQGMGLLGNALNFVPRSLFNMINNPRSAGAYFKGAFGEGLSTGLKEAAAAMKGRGLYKVSKYGDKSLVSALELLRKKGPSTLPEWIAYIASAGTRLRYVFRIMQAIDALAWNTAREGHAYLAAHRALLEQEKMSDTKRSPEEFSRAFIDSLGGDTAQIEEDLRAARQALIDAGQPPSMLTVDRMARETRNLRRAAGGVKAGNRFADRIVLQQDPEGSGKFISNLIDVFQKKDILGLPIGQLLIPFNRIVSNLFEQSLDYTPVGLVRAFLGGHLSDVKPGSFWNGKVEFKDKSQLFDQMERRERAMAAVTGMAAAAIIYALASAHEDEPDEDVPFMVYGWGPESKNKRAQMPKGWVPYSIKIGDNYIKFSEMPFGMMLAAAGSAMDAMRYKNMDKKTSTQRLAYVLKTAAKGFLNQGVMSSLDTAMETLMFDASEKKMADIPVNALKGLVPAQGMLRDISTIMDPNKVSSESLTSALLRDIPFAKSWGTKPDLNVFGEPIKLDGYPITRRIITHREPHAVADYLGRNELHIPGMEQTIEIGKYLPDKAKDRIQARAVELGAMENGLFTPEQNYTFKKRAGELTKVAVQEIMEKNPKIATDKQRESIQSTINKRVEAARRRAMLEAVPVK